MRPSILILAIVYFGFFSSNTFAQTPNNFECPAFVPQTLPADRIGNARKCHQHGLELIESGQLAQAVDIFRQALQFDPEYAEAYAALGRTYFKLREWEKAIENLNRAASLNRKQREANESALKKAPIEVNKPSEPLTAPHKETQSTSTPAKDNSNQSNTGNDTSQLKPPKEAEAQRITSPPSAPQNVSAPRSKAPEEAEVKNLAGPTPAASKNSDLPAPTPIGASVATSVTPAAKVEETAGPAVSALPPSEDLPLTKIYRVGPNDVLDVRLNDSDQQSTLYTVTAAGLLEHPLLTEPMSVAGLTVEEIGARIEEDLRKRAISENPKAVVGVRDYSSHAVLVSGLVKNAGTKFLRREAIPLYVVVADAQPLPEASRVSVVRNESNQIYEIDLNQAADMIFLVRSGDVITLSRDTTQFIYIGGEVKLPGEKTYRRGLTLMQAILSAGGVGPKAKIAEIARDDGKGFLIPTRFKLKEIVDGKTMDPILKPGDRISVLR